jgi:hypothetical protein
MHTLSRQIPRILKFGLYSVAELEPQKFSGAEPALASKNILSTLLLLSTLQKKSLHFIV